MPDPTTYTIMIVEDEPGFRRTYTDLFKDAGHEVLTAEDGRQCLKMLEKQRPQLILLDLVMPEMGGYEVLQNLQEDQELSSIPVIVFSVLSEQSDIQRALDLGAKDYIVKGLYSPREVLGKVGRYLVGKS